ELGGHGAAIEHDVGSTCAEGRVVERPRDQLLTRAALPFDEDGDVARSDALEDREDLAHRHALADELAERARRGRGDVARVPARLDRDRRVTDGEDGTEWDFGVADPRFTEKGAVAAAEIANDDPSCGLLDREVSP